MLYKIKEAPLPLGTAENDKRPITQGKATNKNTKQKEAM
jgi:hypothetical protein